MSSSAPSCRAPLVPLLQERHERGFVPPYMELCAAPADGQCKGLGGLWAIVFCGGKVMPGTRIQPRLQAFQFFLPLASSVGGKHDRRT
ncbi:hypothetical protein IE4872_CH01904 [Rhizobium gallicum]|uniref:Uncharacterized protein n=1 Tax=Rhizobium gallicum TaxID=56730 RepID=A0A1L5NI33_9HYPH|nr:hypothetical protein IE4872_CH01904 [Rhizobium gallicum]